MAKRLPGAVSSEFMSQTTPADETTVLLYVKAGANGVSYGACPFCQSGIMMLLCKAELTYVSYRIKTVDLRNPPDEFKQFANKVPFLKYGETINITDMDEFVNFFDSIWSDHRIETKSRAARAAARDLFSKFCFFIKGVANSPAALLRELTKIDRFLSGLSSQFVDGETMTDVDCLLLPKLQHIRIAAKVYRGFEIPLELKNLWGYLHNAYQSKTFRSCCPTDQEIVHYWSDYPGVPMLSAANRKLFSVKAAPVYTLEVPEEVRPAVKEQADDPTDLSVENVQINDSTEVQMEPAEVQAEPAEVQAEPAEVQAEPAGVQAEPAEVQAEPAEVQAEPAEVQAEPAEVQAEPTEVQAEPAEVQAEPTEPAKDENRDSGNEEQSKDGSNTGEQTESIDNVLKTKSVSFKDQEGDSADRSAP